MSRIVHTDCSQYRGSMPCAPHKATGVVCASCPVYRPCASHVAVVKLGAMGDVLRTGALLGAIGRRHPDAGVVWVTRPESLPFVRRFEGVREAVSIESAALLAASRVFDHLYAFDNDIEGLAIASALRSSGRSGFRAGIDGRCVGVQHGGDPTLYELGLWDDLKRRNQRSYLELLAAAAGLSYDGARPPVVASASALDAADRQLHALDRVKIGINNDAGGRWTRKQWNAEYVEAAVATFVERGFDVVLFGAGSAATRNASLAATYAHHVVAFASNDDVEQLFAGIARCAVLLTGDTLGLHVAWAVGTPVVALFGPTSLPEIDVALGDVKVAATELPCLGCYLPTCRVDPHCMDRLEPERVVNAVFARLAAASATAQTTR